MFRGELSSFSEGTRPPRRAPWLLLVVLLLAGVVVVHVAGLAGPLKSKAMQLLGASPVPAYRLVGTWESGNDPMFQRVCYSASTNGSSGTGTYMADAGRGMRAVMFKVISEDRSGRRMEMAEFLPETNANYRVRYTIAEDGQSMTREYEERNGTTVSCQYRYVGPPTLDPTRQVTPKSK